MRQRPERAIQRRIRRRHTLGRELDALRRAHAAGGRPRIATVAAPAYLQAA